MKDLMFESTQNVKDSILAKKVKGCSAFGRAQAWALFFAIADFNGTSQTALATWIGEKGQEVCALRPTMAAMENVRQVVNEYVLGTDCEKIEALKKNAQKLCMNLVEHSFNAVEKLGEYGSEVIQDGMTVMTHSFSSGMMSVLETALKRDKKFKIICTESRPLRESVLGIRQLQKLGAEIVFLSDASMYMGLKMADIALTSADTLMYDGRIVNKMGTETLATLCRLTGKPFYVASELMKLDMRTRYGYQPVLQRRIKEELIYPEDFGSMDGITVINQFFDITPAAAITGLIHEKGITASNQAYSFWESTKRELMKI